MGERWNQIKRKKEAGGGHNHQQNVRSSRLSDCSEVCSSGSTPVTGQNATQKIITALYKRSRCKKPKKKKRNSFVTRANILYHMAMAGSSSLCLPYLRGERYRVQALSGGKIKQNGPN